MKALIEEVNEKLSYILSSLESRKFEVEDSLANVQDKIDDKIEEARGYKVDVDAAKEEIKKFEGEIESLEKDLSDLTARFSNKDLNAILETGNKEINNQILAKQKEIAKQREKIAEYTEKARMIKDLLISLKRDKETKKSKLNNLNEIYAYYEKELNRIMTYASENPDNLIIEIKEEEPEEEVESYEFKNEPIVDDKVVFDAIESIEKADEEDLSLDDAQVITENGDTNDTELVVSDENPTTDSEKVEETNPYEISAEEEPLFENKNIFDIEEEKSIEEEKAEEPAIESTNEPIEQPLNEPTEEPIIDTESVDSKEEENISSFLDNFNLFSEEELNAEPVHEEDLYKNNDNISSLFNQDSNDSFDSFDFKALSESIDREYESIFGNSEEIKLNDEDDTFTKKEEQPITQEEPTNQTTNDFDFFGNTEPIENILNTQEEKEEISPLDSLNLEEINDVSNTEVINFFKNNNIDFEKFKSEEQETLINEFNLISYTKTLDILRKNNIRLDLIYGAAGVFKMVHNELENIINKLLLAGQSTLNISYVLNALPYIKDIDLQDVIDSYGPAIKDANITDLIIKAKHLNDLGGGNN